MSYNFTELQNVINNWVNDPEPEIAFIDPEPNNIIMMTKGVEMLKVTEDGFYVRGVKVPADEKEAASVYKAFKEFLVWSRLHRD